MHIILRVLGVVNSIREPGKGGKSLEGRKLECERRKLPGQRQTQGMGWGWGVAIPKARCGVWVKAEA